MGEGLLLRVGLAGVLALVVASDPAAARNAAAKRMFDRVKGDLNYRLRKRTEAAYGGYVTWRGGRWNVYFPNMTFGRTIMKVDPSNACRARMAWYYLNETCYFVSRPGGAKPRGRCYKDQACNTRTAYHTGRHPTLAREVRFDFARVRIGVETCGYTTVVGKALRGCLVKVHFGRRLQFRYSLVVTQGGRYFAPLRKRCVTGERQAKPRRWNVFVFWSRSRRDRFVRALRRMRRVCRR